MCRRSILTRYSFEMATVFHEFRVCCIVAIVTDTMTLTHTAALARLGHALSDDTRTRVLLTLREAPAYPSDLADALGVSRQVMSNQLACLRGCGLVEAVPDGRRTWYRLADPLLVPALNDLLRLVLVVDPTCCSTEECTCA
jgi:ArsR family transcriptional regulator, cadmium/lead-responsive transcriptional repressor